MPALCATSCSRVPKPKAEKPGDDLEGWHEGKDALVLAVAMSVWAAERFLRKADSVPAGGLGYPGVVGGCARECERWSKDSTNG